MIIPYVPKHHPFTSFSNFLVIGIIFFIKTTRFEYFKVSIKDYNYVKSPYDLSMYTNVLDYYL